jgi:hypothetical protein
MRSERLAAGGSGRQAGGRFARALRVGVVGKGGADSKSNRSADGESGGADPERTCAGSVTAAVRHRAGRGDAFGRDH